ncbi:hypothetical protein [Campylobacter jejuni]|uniref:hypothetical protein n=1 Tax=Campylobacter jejuni TaxID=197 RepID=UPI003F541198
MSIFSINDNSNYGSILSQSKANIWEVILKSEDPEDFKIHKSTLDEIERYYDSFDMASIVKSHYNSFNQVISAFPNDKTSFRKRFRAITKRTK